MTTTIDEVRNYWKRGEHLSIPTIQSYMRQLLSAVEYLHKHNYYHCDIKPGNVLVFEDSRVKLADLGLVNKTPINSSYIRNPCNTFKSPQQFGFENNIKATS